MSELIAATTAAATSADFTLAAGESATVFMTDGNGGSVFGQAEVQIKSASGQYFTVPGGTLNASNGGVKITAAGTYRVVKWASQEATGVDKV